MVFSLNAPSSENTQSQEQLFIGGSQNVEINEIVQIDFFNNGLLADNAQQVIAAVEANAGLNKSLVVELSENFLTDLGLTNLESVLLNPNVTEIQLDNNQLTATGIKYLCETLKRRVTPLQGLSLSENHVGLEGAQELAAYLKDFSQLKALVLHNCQLPPEGIKLLAESLFKNTTLETLNLNANFVNTSVEDIAKMLRHNRRLESLELVLTELDSATAYLLADGLICNKSLHTLNIDNNNLDDNFSEMFATKIKYNITLSNYIGPDTADKKIATICKQNRILPSNSLWSTKYNPNINTEDKYVEMILATKPSNQASLFFLATKKFIESKTVFPDTFSAELKHYLKKSAFQEACQQRLFSVKKTNKP